MGTQASSSINRLGTVTNCEFDKGESKEGSKGDVELIESHIDALVFLELSEGDFDIASGRIELPVIGNGFFPIGFAGDDRGSAAGCDEGTDVVGIVTLVGNNREDFPPIPKRPEILNRHTIMGVARAQHKAVKPLRSQRKMKLRAQSGTVSADALKPLFPAAPEPCR